MRFPTALLAGFALLFTTACATLDTSHAPPEQTRIAYVQAHTDLPARIKVAIRKGVPAEGMTMEQLRAAIGAPMRVNTTQVEGQVMEQWVYYNGGLYVYLRNGTVHGMQY
jgi:hypothetical protein